MFASLRTFLQTPEPGKIQAAQALRLIFAGVFFAQLLIAALLSVVMALLTNAQQASDLTSLILLGFIALQFPAAMGLATLLSRASGKTAAMSAVIALAIVLSSSGWFTAFAFLIGSRTLFIILMLMLTMAYYAFGVLFAGSYATKALEPPDQPTRVSKDVSSASDVTDDDAGR